MPKIQAFIARSFNEQDEINLKPILDFLRSFEILGFFCVHADRAEVESVSRKVRQLIDNCEVLIGFFTRRYPIYSEAPPSTETSAPTATDQPILWTTAPWVLQESGYALRGEKDLILLREQAVELPGLQGDLEYIPFDLKNLAPVYEKLTQMVSGIIAKKTGTQVLTSVVHSEALGESPAEPTKSEGSEQEKGSPMANPAVDPHDENRNVIVRVFIAMSHAAGKKDWGEAEKQFKEGLVLISEGKASGVPVSAIEWESFYYRELFTSGDGSGLDKLKALASANPDNPAPLEAIARCYSSYDRHEDAAEWWKRAAEKEKSDGKAGSLLDAARELKKANMVVESLKLGRLAYSLSERATHAEAAQLIYEILREGEDINFAFGFAELALNEMPHHSMRFDLGLDYHKQGLHELAFLHFDMLHRHDTTNSGSLHNLALSSSNCNLPIGSVRRYKQAFAGGSTLSASNLAYRYLDAGMTDEAAAILGEALKIEGHDSEVESALAAISDRTKEEEKSEVEALTEASTQRKFFASVGTGLETVASPIDGIWRLPMGDLALKVEGLKVLGQTVTEPPKVIQSNAQAFSLAALALGGSSTEPTEYEFSGVLMGTACKFKIIRIQRKADAFSILAGYEQREGYMSFSASGASAEYAEIESKRPKKIRTVWKIDP